jgi:hypothetical protein
VAGMIRQTEKFYNLIGNRICYLPARSTAKLENVRTSQETHLWVSKVCYGYSFNFLHVDDVRTCRKHTYGPPRPVMEIALLFYMQMMFVPQGKHRTPFLRG